MKKSQSVEILKYDVIFEEDPEGGYSAMVPNLPGCISEGETFEETKTNIADAIKLYLEDMAEAGEEIPEQNTKSFIGQVEVCSGNAKVFKSFTIFDESLIKKYIFGFIFYVAFCIITNYNCFPSYVITQIGICSRKIIAV